MSNSIPVPSVGVLVKLGSIAVHADELLSPEGHAFDRSALESLVRDPDVLAWLRQMDRLALLPKKRTAPKWTPSPESVDVTPKRNRQRKRNT